MCVTCNRRSVLKMGCLAAVWGGVSRVMGATVKHHLPPVDLSFISDTLTVIRRSEWADVDARPWRLREAVAFNRITVHHGGSVVDFKTSKERVEQIIEGMLLDHRNRNYGDMGYHFVVDFAGRVWEARSLAYEGAHTSRQNEGNIGVVLLGNFQEQNPARKQLDALKILIESLRERYRIKRHRIYGHRDLAQSLCPGERLYGRIRAFRSGDEPSPITRAGQSVSMSQAKMEGS